jgi:hypothetical protein
MNKWGVRLIGACFFVMATSDFYKLITGNGRTNGFLGFDLGLKRYGNPIEVMAWIEAAFFIYVGVQLLRFRPSGRYGALLVLGLASIGSGFGLVLVIAILINHFITGTSHPFTASNMWLGEIGEGIVAGVVMTGIFISFFIPAYFLMRKDVKPLFDKIGTTETNAPNSEVTAS